MQHYHTFTVPVDYTVLQYLGLVAVLRVGANRMHITGLHANTYATNYGYTGTIRQVVMITRERERVRSSQEKVKQTTMHKYRNVRHASCFISFR